MDNLTSSQYKGWYILDTDDDIRAIFTLNEAFIKNIVRGHISSERGFKGVEFTMKDGTKIFIKNKVQ